MANVDSLAAVGTSLVRLIGAAFLDSDPIPDSMRKAKAVLARTEDFDRSNASTIIVAPCLSVFLYRVDVNKTMRASWSAVGSLDGHTHLPLDVHLMITPWADNAEHELKILGAAMQALEAVPSLAGPLLDPSGGWAPNESVQLVIEDVSAEAVMRTYDSLPHDYKLSVPYVARVVRLDSRRARPDPDVTTRVAGLVPSAAP